MRLPGTVSRFFVSFYHFPPRLYTLLPTQHIAGARFWTFQSVMIVAGGPSVNPLLLSLHIIVIDTLV